MPGRGSAGLVAWWQSRYPAQRQGPLPLAAEKGGCSLICIAQTSNTYIGAVVKVTVSFRLSSPSCRDTALVLQAMYTSSWTNRPRLNDLPHPQSPTGLLRSIWKPPRQLLWRWRGLFHHHSRHRGRRSTLPGSTHESCLDTFVIVQVNQLW